MLGGAGDTAFTSWLRLCIGATACETLGADQPRNDLCVPSVMRPTRVPVFTAVAALALVAACSGDPTSGPTGPGRPGSHESSAPTTSATPDPTAAPTPTVTSSPVTFDRPRRLHGEVAHVVWNNHRSRGVLTHATHTGTYRVRATCVSDRPDARVTYKVLDARTHRHGALVVARGEVRCDGSQTVDGVGPLPNLVQISFVRVPSSVTRAYADIVPG